MIRAGGDALVDVFFVVRLVDPVLEVEELRVGERRDLRQDRASTSPRRRSLSILFHLDAVDAMLSRTSSPSTRRAKKDAGAPTLSVRFVLKLPVAKARDASRPAKKP